MYKDFELDENNPTKENIEYVLGKILFCLTSAATFNDYARLKEKTNNVLSSFIEMISIYINSGELLNIPYSTIDAISIDIAGLDYETIPDNGMYLEMADVWFSILIGYYNILQSNNYAKR